MADVLESALQTAVCSIEQDKLIYRGYEIHDLAEHASFEEVAFLLLEGHKPSKDELARFKKEVIAERALPSAVVSFIESAGGWLASGRAVPMDVLRTAVSTSGTRTLIARTTRRRQTFARPSDCSRRSRRSWGTCSA